MEDGVETVLMNSHSFSKKKQRTRPVPSGEIIYLVPQNAEDLHL
jgi:hypothetical protein